MNKNAKNVGTVQAVKAEVKTAEVIAANAVIAKAEKPKMEKPQVSDEEKAQAVIIEKTKGIKSELSKKEIPLSFVLKKSSDLIDFAVRLYLMKYSAMTTAEKLREVHDSLARIVQDQLEHAKIRKGLESNCEKSKILMENFKPFVGITTKAGNLYQYDKDELHLDKNKVEHKALIEFIHLVKCAKSINKPL